MPLHSEGSSAFDLDRLDEAVIGTTDGSADRDNAVTELVDSLVVEAIHLDLVAVHGMSHTAGLEGDAMMGRSRVVARFDMGGKVLVQRATEVDVHHLYTAADAENGKVDLEGGVKKPTFVRIAMRVGVTEIRVGFLTELRRIDVVAAAEQEAIESFNDLRTAIGRNPDGNSASSLHSPGVVAVVDVNVGGAQHVEHVDQRRSWFLLARDADERLHVRKRTSAEGAFVSRDSFATAYLCGAPAGSARPRQRG